MYEPKPIDTSGIKLDLNLINITERLAENAHDNWAALRIAQGWTWGLKRNDDAKLHPGLVPYADLSESEKEYDRATAMETVKVLVKLDYLPSEEAIEQAVAEAMWHRDVEESERT